VSFVGYSFSVGEADFAAEVFVAGKGWRRVAVCPTIQCAARCAAQAYAAQVDGQSPSQVRITKRDGSLLHAAA
jgi:hypothetical protein